MSLPAHSQSPPLPVERIRFTLLIVLNLIIAGLLGSIFYALNKPHTVAPQAWEHMIQGISDESFTEKMNEMGKSGWELVFARRASDGHSDPTMSYEIILKRPVPPEP